MNKIMKKLRVPGYETKVIIKPKENDNEAKQMDGFQLSLDIDTELGSSAKDK
nr:hypothetical protein [Paenibacillus bovis]